MREAITRAQMAKIWACAHELGMEKEALYLLVPRGSISGLSRHEAAELIEHLEGQRLTRMQPLPVEPLAAKAEEPRPADPNAATPEQRHFIYFLLGKLDWLQQPARVRGFLHKFAKVDSVEAIPDRKRASAIIEALKAIHKRQRLAARN